jgi:chromosome segregation ATPase
MENEKFQNLVLEHLATLTQEITEIKLDISGLKTDVSGLKADVAELKTDVRILKADVVELKADVAQLKTDVVELKSGQQRMMNQIVKNTEGITLLRQEMRQGFAEHAEAIRVLADMYGRHELELVKLRKRPI